MIFYTHLFDLFYSLPLARPNAKVSYMYQQYENLQKWSNVRFDGCRGGSRAGFIDSFFSIALCVSALANHIETMELSNLRRPDAKPLKVSLSLPPPPFPLSMMWTSFG